MIVIRIKNQGRYMVLKVTDNGMGMSDEQIRTLMDIDTKDHHHIGLKNIASRLELHYQNDYKFEISSREGKGTTVSITIPKYTI